MYTKVANVTQGERPVYQRVGSTVAYLFYWPNVSNWRIGSNYTSDTSGVRSTGNADAACPDQATGWQAVVGGVWVSTYPITVVPTAVGNAPAYAARTSTLRVLWHFAAASIGVMLARTFATTT